MIDSNPKVAVNQKLRAISQLNMQELLHSDLQFSFVNLKKDFIEFLNHSIKFSDEFQLVNNRPKKAAKTKYGNNTKSIYSIKNHLHIHQTNIEKHHPTRRYLPRIESLLCTSFPVSVRWTISPCQGMKFIH